MCGDGDGDWGLEFGVVGGGGGGRRRGMVGGKDGGMVGRGGNI